MVEVFILVYSLWPKQLNKNPHVKSTYIRSKNGNTTQTFSDNHLFVTVSLHFDGGCVHRWVHVHWSLNWRGDMDFKFIVSCQSRGQADAFTSWENYTGDSTQVVVLIQRGWTTLEKIHLQIVALLFLYNLYTINTLIKLLVNFDCFR